MLQFSADPRAAEAPIDAKFVTCRLEEAGAALLALPHTGWSTKLRTSNLEVVRAAMDSYGWGERPVRPPVPSASDITRMDEAMGWIQLIRSTATCCAESWVPAVWSTLSPIATCSPGGAWRRR